MNKYYYDIEHEQIVSLEELKALYLEEIDNKEEIDFPYYVSCCMTYNNGCLETLSQQKYRLSQLMESYIFMESDKEEYQLIIDEIDKLEKLQKESGLQ